MDNAHVSDGHLAGAQHLANVERHVLVGGQAVSFQEKFFLVLILDRLHRLLHCHVVQVLLADFERPIGHSSFLDDGDFLSLSGPSHICKVHCLVQSIYSALQDPTFVLLPHVMLCSLVQILLARRWERRILFSFLFRRLNRVLDALLGP